MPETEAQKKATAKYRGGGNVKQISVKFFPKDHDVYEHIKAKPKVAAYIIDLVRKDMGQS